MRAKIYVDYDYKRLMKKIQKDMPENEKDFAIIDQTEEKVGLLPFFKKTQYKVVACQIDEDYKNEIIQEHLKKIDKIKKPNQNDSVKINDNMSKIEGLVRNLSLKLDSIENKKNYSKEVQLLQDLLQSQDVAQEAIDRIIKSLVLTLTKEELEDREIVIASAKKQIEGYFKDVRVINKDPYEKTKVVMFVGPTGVGKTTTISKLAAVQKLIYGNEKIGVITLDTYREGAIEQIKNLCDYADIPVRVANSRETFEQAVEHFSDCDYIFIDTTGRSQYSVADIRKTQEIINIPSIDIKEVYLVMSATTKYKDMVDIFNSYKKINVNRLIFTKLDETKKYGNLLSFIDKVNNIALSYITTGQTVPKDIEFLSPTKISSFILGFKGIV